MSFIPDGQSGEQTQQPAAWKFGLHFRIPERPICSQPWGLSLLHWSPTKSHNLLLVHRNPVYRIMLRHRGSRRDGLPAYRSDSGISFLAFWITEQNHFEAVLTGVGFARAVPVALPVTVGQTDGTNLG